MIKAIKDFIKKQEERDEALMLVTELFEAHGDFENFCPSTFMEAYDMCHTPESIIKYMTQIETNIREDI